jgi:hypothetical protein
VFVRLCVYYTKRKNTGKQNKRKYVYSKGACFLTELGFGQKLALTIHANYQGDVNLGES